MPDFAEPGAGQVFPPASERIGGGWHVGLKRRLLFRQPVFLHLPPERHRADIQRGGGAFTVPLELVECLANQSLLVFLQVEGFSGTYAAVPALHDLRRKVSYADRRSARE